MEDAAVPYNPEQSEPSTAVERARRKHERILMAIKGVEGVGVGQDATGNPAITVYLRHSGVKVPREVEGFPVVTQVTGVIDAQKR
jgi:hypothetical protein